MAYCRNCGNEILEGTKFCPNCGTAVSIAEHEINQEEINQLKEQSQNNEKFYTSDIYQNHTDNVMDGGNSPIDKFGKFFGIILMIISFVDFFSDPALLTIVLSMAIIVGCVFCFSRKYKQKGFTILALIIAIICLLCGIAQAKSDGLFTIPGKEKAAQEITVETPVETPKVTESVKQVTEPVIKEESKEAVEEDIRENANTEEVESNDVMEEVKEPVNGVDPDLRAFLDSYEAFMDEYVDFMKKYTADPGNVINMLSEYSDIMSRYEEFAQKVDAYDSNEMSTEDAKYYLEVINRCNQKLLDIY